MGTWYLSRENCLALKLQSHTTQSRLIGVEENLEARVKAEVDPLVIFKTANTVEKVTTKVIVLPLGKKCGKCGKDNHFKLSVNPQKKRDHDSSKHIPKGKGKKRFYEVNEDEGVMDDLAKQVQSLFYNDIHFNAVNSRMHTTLKCQTPDGWSSDQVFKIDTGEEGNLMPISMFAVLFPRVSLDALSRTINKEVTLFAYNNGPIKQFGTCSVRLSFKGKSYVCIFFVVEHETALVGITDSEKTGASAS